MKCVIISAGRISDYGRMKKYLSAGDYIIAADGGLLHAKGLCVKPDCVLGDFDSLGYVPEDADGVFPSQKDDTDTMLAVKRGLAKGFADFVLLGCTGGRLDHTAANIAALQYIRNHGARGIIADESTAVRIVGQGDDIQPVMSGQDCYFSVFPFGCEYAVVSMSGVAYPTARQKFDSAFPLGVSNRVTDPDGFRLTVHEGTALIIECEA